jgi:hypothetical protein
MNSSNSKAFDAKALAINAIRMRVGNIMQNIHDHIMNVSKNGGQNDIALLHEELVKDTLLLLLFGN